MSDAVRVVTSTKYRLERADEPRTSPVSLKNFVQPRPATTVEFSDALSQPDMHLQLPERYSSAPTQRAQPCSLPVGHPQLLYRSYGGARGGSSGRSTPPSRPGP